MFSVIQRVAEFLSDGTRTTNARLDKRY